MKLMTRPGTNVPTLSSLFENFFDLTPWTARTNDERIAPLNVFENDKEFVIEVELPGVLEKDLDVKVHDGELTIAAERHHREETKNADYHRIESHFGKFTRTLRLPDSVLTENIEAVFKHGMLTLRVPKAPERTPAKIQVKSS